MNSSYLTSTGTAMPNLRRIWSSNLIRPRTVCRASSSTTYPCSSPRENALLAAEASASASTSGIAYSRG